MINSQRINDLTKKLMELIPEGAKALQTDVNKNIKAILESGLQQMNLVSREEFDVQTALLERTLLKLRTLEEQFKDLENRR
ncbi:hypothetical protein MNBD_GAMMA10-2253 [hydrothermal vent metagenome]|uniref:Ubiquinone biosynthesis accessory factor UbiK n=1 Tax=hydrothermal vent metagenome TaxID=652676 RepID=A0A3B0XIK2_9ZZZZ